MRPLILLIAYVAPDSVMQIHSYKVRTYTRRTVSIKRSNDGNVIRLKIFNIHFCIYRRTIGM